MAWEEGSFDRFSAEAGRLPYQAVGVRKGGEQERKHPRIHCGEMARNDRSEAYWPCREGKEMNYHVSLFAFLLFETEMALCT
jgi:hypothetical protein